MLLGCWVLVAWRNVVVLMVVILVEVVGRVRRLSWVVPARILLGVLPLLVVGIVAVWGCDRRHLARVRVPRCADGGCLLRHLD